MSKNLQLCDSGVTLGDSPNKDLVKDLYNVTGSFKVKKFLVTLDLF
jgi:hypothetical protein